MRGGHLLCVDEQSLAEKASGVAERVWKRFAQLEAAANSS